MALTDKLAEVNALIKLVKEGLREIQRLGPSPGQNHPTHAK